MKMRQFLFIFLSFLPLISAASANCISSFHLQVGMRTADSGFSFVPEDEIKGRLGSSPVPIIGFTRDAHGKIIAVRSNERRFQSIRKLGESGPFGGGWISGRNAREVALIPVSGEVQVKEGAAWNALPAEIQQFFQNQVWTTASWSSPSEGSSWSVLIYEARGYDHFEGRTGTLLKNGYPIVIQNPQGEEFVLGLKGIGLPTGGFENDEHRGILGGLQQVAGEREFETLETPASIGSGEALPVSAGLQTFSIGYGKQAMLLRFEPGTIRATFSKNEAFQSRADAVHKIARGMGQRWGEVLVHGKIAMSHAENIIVDANYEHFFITDMSDVIDVRRLPAKWGHTTRTPEGALMSSIHAVTELEGYNDDVFDSFKKGILAALERSGKLTSDALAEMNTASSPGMLAEKIWRLHLSKEYFFQKRNWGSIPLALEGMNLSDPSLQPGFFDGPYESRVITRMKREVEHHFESAQYELSRTRKESDSYGYRLYTYQNLVAYKKWLEDWAFSPPDIMERVRSHELMELDFQKEGYRSSSYIFLQEAGSVYYSMRTLLDYLKAEKEFLTSVRSAGPAEIDQNLQIIDARFKAIRAMTLVDFHQLASIDGHRWLIEQYFLPYFTKNLKRLPELERTQSYLDHRQVIDQLISAD